MDNCFKTIKDRDPWDRKIPIKCMITSDPCSTPIPCMACAVGAFVISSDKGIQELLKL